MQQGDLPSAVHVLLVPGRNLREALHVLSAPLDLLQLPNRLRVCSAPLEKQAGMSANNRQRRAFTAWRDSMRQLLPQCARRAPLGSSVAASLQHVHFAGLSSLHPCRRISLSRSVV